MKLDEILPPPAVLAHPISGEVIDRDDFEAIKTAVLETDEWLNNWHREHAALYRAKNDLTARWGELEPVDLPPRRNQSNYQERLAECPRCRTRLPRTHIEEPE